MKRKGSFIFYEVEGGAGGIWGPGYTKNWLLRWAIPILVLKSRVPFGQHQESRPLSGSSDIPVLFGFANTIK